MKSLSELEDLGMIDSLDDIFMYGLEDLLTEMGVYNRTSELAHYGIGHGADLDYVSDFEEPAIIEGRFCISRKLYDFELSHIRKSIMEEMKEFKPKRVVFSFPDDFEEKSIWLFVKLF